MSLNSSPQPEQVDAAKAHRSLRNGFITLALALALAVGLLVAVPGLKGVAITVSKPASCRPCSIARPSATVWAPSSMADTQWQCRSTKPRMMPSEGT